MPQINNLHKATQALIDAVLYDPPDFDPSQLIPGLYRIHWRDGTKSLAAVGTLKNDQRWFMPCEWDRIEARTDWDLVASVNYLQGMV